MKTIIIYVRNKTIRPSDYYRIVQYVKDFDYEVIIRSAVPDKLDRWALDNRDNKINRVLALFLSYIFIVKNFIVGYVKDKKLNPKAIIVIREIFPRKIFIFRRLLEKKCKKIPVIWDFDDSIIGNEISQVEADLYFKYAKRIIVSTPYLKKNLPIDVQIKTDVLCTTDGDLSSVDLQSITAKRIDSYKQQIDIVWVATGSNLPNLLDICDYLDSAAKLVKEKLNKQLVLKVVCNKGLNRDFNYLLVKNIKWTHDIALKEILSAHIGIMPLIENQFALGKAGFKLIQYMSSGLPIIASDTGFNASIVDSTIGFAVKQNDDKGWINAIYCLSNDVNIWKDYSEASYKKWHIAYSYKEHLEFWKNLIEKI